MNILVLGGGQQGRVVGDDLARTLPHAGVTVADVRRPGLAALPNLSWREADLADATACARLMREHDLAVGALPARFGFATMRAAIDAKRPLVDVSFCAEDPLTLDAEARAAGVAILPDCGLAPGLSHLFAGLAVVERGAPDELMIYVGGVAQDRTRPYGYVVTWSLDDLQEEYQRPARIQSAGVPATVPVFSDPEPLEVEGVGTLEAFYSDGLRTALTTLAEVREMGEKTLRWPGHVEAIRPLLASGRFVEELRARCTADPPADLVVMLVRSRWGARETRALLVDRYDPVTRLTAMARTTALTTSAVAQLVAAGFPLPAGVRPLELVAREPGAAARIVATLAARGVRVVSTEHTEA